VLPLAVLSGIALYFLRQDKASVEHDARDRAEAIAPELARQLGQRAGEIVARKPAQPAQLEGVIAGGQIRSPLEYSRLPTPPDWPGDLTPDQAKLWNDAQEAIYQKQDAAGTARTLRLLAASSAPAAARANAEYNLLLLGPKTALARQAVALARKFRGVLTASGAPLSDLALFAAFRELRATRLDDGLLGALAESVREHPSFLTPELLDAAERAAAGPDALRQVQTLKAAWSAQEKTLVLLRAVMRRQADLAKPGEIWVEADSQPFLALASPLGDGCHVSLIPAPALEQAFRDAITASELRLPTYAAMTVEIGGQRRAITRGGQRPGIQLVSAPGRLNGEAPHAFGLALLADPDLLYAGYQRRLWLTAALILSAAVTALLSLATLWRGYRRQILLSEMKSNFVSSVSHELRAPIAAVRLMAESLDRGRVGGEVKQREYFRLIVQECRRISALVENVLDFSRIDQGRKRYVFEPLDLPELIRRTVALMQPCAAERNIALKLADPSPEATGVEPCWDHQAVEQSLVNLIDNAIKYSPPGSEVNVRVEAAPPVVRIWVEDRGSGVPPEAQARIFDLFYRHGSELRRENKGAGIGLSIVKHVAEAHGGRVLVESAAGQGSRFALELPLAAPASSGKESA
jgi:signal transduction histidine kinase